MTGAGATLLALQHGDSFFPSGSVAFSFGLETLRTDALVVGAPELEVFIDEQLRSRWATLDLGILAEAWQNSNDSAALRTLDRVVESMTLPAELRNGSKTGGAALLGVHASLETDGAAAYAELVYDEQAHGHLAVVQGLVWRNCGLTLQNSMLVSGHGFVVGIVGAALRLGVIGHLDAQRALRRAHEIIETTVRTAPPPVPELHAYTPLAEIAAMRHERQVTRLFSN